MDSFSFYLFFNKIGGKRPLPLSPPNVLLILIGIHCCHLTSFTAPPLSHFCPAPPPPTSDRLQRTILPMNWQQLPHVGDGTNFCIPQKGGVRKGNPFGSHKYVGKSTLRYELGVNILAGSLVWIQGLYPAGVYLDIKIFNKVL